MSIALFNLKDGFEEAICRGLRQSLLTGDDYRKVSMAETLEDMRSALEDTDYGSFLQDEPSPLSVAVVSMKAREKLADDFHFLQAMANEPLTKFLNFIIVEKMIDNVVNIIQGALNKKAPEELIARADPLGWAPEMKALISLDFSAGGYEELYRTVLIDTPVGPYFEEFLNSREQEARQAGGGGAGGGGGGAGGARTMEDIGLEFRDIDLEVIRAALKKSWLESFYAFCQDLGSTTAEVMGDVLKKEADFLVLSVTLNSLNTAMGESTALASRNSLFPHFGYLYPEGTDRMRKAYNDATVRASLDCFPQYQDFYEQCKGFYIVDEAGQGDPGLALGTGQGNVGQGNAGGGGGGGGGTRPGTANTAAPVIEQKSLEDCLFQEEIKICEMCFEQQMHYGVFFAWVKLREQEIRNLTWIADMITMHRREKVDQILPLFASRY